MSYDMLKVLFYIFIAFLSFWYFNFSKTGKNQSGSFGPEWLSNYIVPLIFLLLAVFVVV